MVVILELVTGYRIKCPGVCRMIQKQYITSQSVLEPLTVALLLDVMRHNEVQCVAYLFRTRGLL